MSLIEFQNICKKYKSGNEILNALDNINIRIENGEFLSIVGQSGSGKSTLMNIMGCLDNPTSGIYRLDGKDVSYFSEKKLSKIRNQKIGFIFQSFNLIPTLSAVENVELPLMYRGLGREKRRKIATQALEKVGLEKRIKHKPSQLSGGQQQRVAIARALSLNPEIILADEPTGNLDTASGNEIMRLLETLNNEGTTLIIITHDNKIANRTKRVISISDGKIV